MQQMHKWKEALLDVCLLTLYQLQCFNINNFHLGCADHGDCHLDLDDFRDMATTGMGSYSNNLWC